MDSTSCAQLEKILDLNLFYYFFGLVPGIVGLNWQLKNKKKEFSNITRVFQIHKLRQQQTI